jgi:predicted house-cleaning noncanonical NTP pyrophosphatase (MazG superfamily)
MKMKEYNKLIRDRIVDVIEKDGRKAIVRILDESEYAVELKKKLVEEVGELLNAVGESVLEEMADVYEVLQHLLEVYGFSEEDLLIAKAKKAQTKGSLKSAYFWLV